MTADHPPVYKRPKTSWGRMKWTGSLAMWAFWPPDFMSAKTRH